MKNNKLLKLHNLLTEYIKEDVKYSDLDTVTYLRYKRLKDVRENIHAMLQLGCSMDIAELTQLELLSDEKFLLRK